MIKGGGGDGGWNTNMLSLAFALSHLLAFPTFHPYVNGRWVQRTKTVRFGPLKTFYGMKDANDGKSLVSEHTKA